MAAPKSKSNDILLKNLVPLNALTDEQLSRLQRRVVVEKAKKGDYLFSEGDTDHQNIYLLSGTVALLSGQKEIDMVTSGSQTARFALAHQLPRKHSARAKCPVTYVRIDSRLLSDLLARSQSASYEVNETGVSSKGDWMSQLLQSPIFQQIPPANLQRVMMRMREIEVAADEVIIQQGDEGDYFYLISRGQCRVTHQPDPAQPPIELALLAAGQGFGEEALLSDKPRSSTVIMQTDGELVRLSKKDFVELVKQPVSNYIDYTQACSMLEDGALWVDVRTPEEYETAHLPGAINLPYFSLRFQAPSLAEERTYLVYGAEVGQIATASYLLMERGYEVSVVTEIWQEITLQAGLDALVIEPLNENIIEINQEKDVVSDSCSSEIEQQTEQNKNELPQKRDDTSRELEVKLGRYQAEQKQLKQALVAAKRKIELAQQERVNLKNERDQELQRLQEALVVAEGELSKHRESKGSERKLKLQIQEFEEKLDQLQDELRTSRADAEQASKLQAQLEKALETALQQSKQEEDKLKEELNRLSQQLELSANSQRSLEQQATEQGHAHSESLSSLEVQLKTAQEETELVRQQAAAKRMELEGQRDELQRKMQSILADDEQASRKANKTVDDLKQELATLQQQHSTLQEEMSGLRQAKDVADMQHHEATDNLVKELLNARGSLEEMERVQQQLESERVSASSVHEQALVEANQRTRDVEAELKALKEMQATTQGDYQQSLAGLQGQLDEAGKQLQQEQELFRIELDQAQQKVSELEQAVDASDKRCEELEKDLVALRMAKESIEQEHQRSVAVLDADRSQIRRTVDELQLSNQHLTTQNQTLQERLVALEEILGQEQQEKLELGQEVANALAKIEDMQQQKAVAYAQEQQNQSSFEHALEESKAEAEASLEALKETRVELKNLDEQRIKLQALFEQEHETAEFLRRSLETAEDAVEISDTTIEDNNQEIATIKQQLQNLQSDLEGLGASKAELEQAHNHAVEELEGERARHKQDLERMLADQSEALACRQFDMERLQTEKAHLETQLAQYQNNLQEKQQAFDTATAEQQHRVEQLEKELTDAKVRLEVEDREQVEKQDEQQALQLAQQEIAKLNKIIEGLGEVQLEMESQFSEDSAEELLRLRTALEIEEKKRRHAEELARQADVLRREREVQETAVEMLGEDIEDLSRANAQLIAEKAALAQQLAEYRGQASDSNQADDSLAQLEMWHARAEAYEQERDKAKTDVARMKGEITELRSVIQTYVAQIQNNEPLDSSDELHALRAELEMVRIQAAQDLEQVRTQSNAAETRIKHQNDRDVDTVASIQALRQQIDSNQKALSEKEQLLHMSHSQCRTLEDAIEDRDKEIDHLRRKLESFLRKTGGLGEISEMLNSSMTELSHRLFEESERLTNQHKGQLSKELKDDSVDNQRTSLGRLFRKR